MPNTHKQYKSLSSVILSGDNWSLTGQENTKHRCDCYVTGPRRKVRLRDADRQHRGRRAVATRPTSAAVSSVPREPTSVLRARAEPAVAGRRTADCYRTATADWDGGRRAGDCLPRRVSA